MRTIRMLMLVLGAAVVAIALVAGLARFADGPIGPFPGGALGGSLDSNPRPDWSAAGATVELQIRPERPWSLQAYAIPHRGELYVPSFYAARRRWVPVALADPRVVVRLGDRLYERRLERVDDPARRAELIDAMAARHGYDPNGIVASDATWYFHLAPR